MDATIFICCYVVSVDGVFRRRIDQEAFELVFCYDVTKNSVVGGGPEIYAAIVVCHIVSEDNVVV